MAETEDVRGGGAEMGGPGRRGVGFPGEEVEARWLLWCITVAGFGVGVHCQRVRETEEALGAEGLVDRRDGEEWTERKDWPTAKRHFISFRFRHGRKSIGSSLSLRDSLFIYIYFFK